MFGGGIILSEFNKIETKRLIIKKISEDDLEDFHEYAGNPLVGSKSLWKPHKNLQESKEILNGFLKDDEYLGIHHKNDKKLIGILGLHEDSSRKINSKLCRELGYGINYDYWNKGYMTEACLAILDWLFVHKNLEIITGTTSLENKSSQRVMEKIGMKKEGVIRYGWINYKGEIKDKFISSIKKDEYFN